MKTVFILTYQKVSRYRVGYPFRYPTEYQTPCPFNKKLYRHQHGLDFKLDIQLNIMQWKTDVDATKTVVTQITPIANEIQSINDYAKKVEASQVSCLKLQGIFSAKENRGSRIEALTSPLILVH